MVWYACRGLRRPRQTTTKASQKGGRGGVLVLAMAPMVIHEYQ